MMGTPDPCDDPLQRKRNWNMPHKMTGAEIEPRVVVFGNLFEIRRLVDIEIKRRAEEYLRLLGYEWYRMTELIVTMTERGPIDIVNIRAKYEYHHQEFHTDIEVPLAQFQLMVRPEKEDGIRSL